MRKAYFTADSWPYLWFGFLGARGNKDGMPIGDDLIDATWQPEDLPLLVKYLKHTDVVVSSFNTGREVQVCGCGYDLSNNSFLSDGKWLYPNALHHWVECHHMWLPTMLVLRIRSLKYIPPKCNISVRDLPWPQLGRK